jgi:hypothetical protein
MLKIRLLMVAKTKLPIFVAIHRIHEAGAKTKRLPIRATSFLYGTLRLGIGEEKAMNEAVYAAGGIRISRTGCGLIVWRIQRNIIRQSPGEGVRS